MLKKVNGEAVALQALEGARSATVYRLGLIGHAFATHAACFMGCKSVSNQSEPVQERKLPFQRALYIALKTGISQGMFRPNARLPATRELAQTLAVARNSVLYAYEQLIVEGYLLSSRQGTRVARIARAQSGDAHSLDNPAGIGATHTRLGVDLIGFS